MNNKFKIIILGTALFLLIFLTLLFNFLTKRQTGSGTSVSPETTGGLEQNEPVPTLTAPVEGGSYYVVSTTPVDKAINVPIDQAITMTFNRGVKLTDIEFGIDPNFKYSTQVVQNKLIIKPLENLTPSTIYTYSVNFPVTGEFAPSFSFISFGPTPQFQPNTAPKNYEEVEDKFLLEKHPDIFLSNKVPYSSRTFSISSLYKRQPSGHFAFIVELKDISTGQSKADAVNWMKSLGLSGQQINQLDIEYRS